MEQIEYTIGYKGVIHGNYVVLTPDGSLSDAKAALLEQIHSTIDELAKDDRFWIVKDCSPEIYPNATTGSRTVAWKIETPQMAEWIDTRKPEWR